MIKKMLGVFTSVIAALAVVGVAWAGTDDGTSTSVTAAGESATSVSIDDSSSSTDATVASSTEATVASSTGATLDSSTSTSAEAATSTSAEAATSTSLDDDREDDDDLEDDDDSSTTTTTIDDHDRVTVPDGVTTHTIPGVGSVTIEVSAGQMTLVSVSAPGWDIEHDKLESDRIELEFTNTLDVEAEFEARIENGRVKVEIEVDSD